MNIDKKKREEREAKKQMVKNEAMAGVFGKGVAVDTDLIQKVDARDKEFDKVKKKKAVSFGQTGGKDAANDGKGVNTNKMAIESSVKSDT